MSGTKLFSPCDNFIQVTPSDADPIKNSNNEAVESRFLIVDADGDVSCVNADGDAVVLTLKAGILYPISTGQIKATGTSAIGIIALW